MIDTDVLRGPGGETRVSAVSEGSSAGQANWRRLPPARFLRGLLFVVAGTTLFLIALGGATRVMNAGLSCPDWPLCYGEVIPQAQMNLRVFLEWFHRLVASSVGLLTLILAGTALWNYRALPRWVSGLSVLALVLVLVQGMLGGLTVTELLRFDIVTAHLGTAMLYLGTLLVLLVGLSPASAATGDAGKLPWVALAGAIVIYAQSLLGGLVASQWALHACVGSSLLCGVMNNHLFGILPAVLAVLAVVVVAWRTPELNSSSKRAAYWAGSLLLLQLGLGLATFRLQLQVEPLTVAHLVTGVALFGSLVVLTTLSLRQRAQLLAGAHLDVLLSDPVRAGS